MVLATLVWLYASFVSFAYGIALLASLRKMWGLADDMPRVPVVLVTGLGVVAVLAMVLSLLGGVGAVANVAVLGGAILACRRIRLDASTVLRAERARWRAAMPVVKVLACGAVLVALERSTDSPLVGDSGLYHAQAIRWIEEVGVAPGLGNLHARLAIDSAAFALEALFGFSFLGLGHLHALNGWLCLCLMSVLLHGVDDVLAGRRTAPAWTKLFLLASFLPLFAGWLSSPTPDLTLAIVLWIVFLLAADIAEDTGRFEIRTPALAMAVASTFALLIKPSAAPVALLAAAVLAAAWRASRSRAAVLAALLAAMLIPFESRQLLLSGYPLFPFAWLDPFDFDWRVPRRVVIEITGWILSWARVPLQQPSEVLRMSPAKWLPSWFARLRNADRLLLLAIPMGTAILAARRFARGPTRPPSSAGRWLDVTLFAGVGFWFALVPDPRFGIGFYPVLGAFLLARVAGPLLRRMPARAISYGLAALVATEIGVLYMAHPDALSSLGDRVVRPAGYPIEPTVDVKGANFTVSVPQRSDRCWYEPFPCTPYAPGERIERRGDGWASGFRATAAGRPPPSGE